MKLEVTRYTLRIRPSSILCSDHHLDVAFIEEVLGLKHEGDSIKLIRRNVYGIGSIAYLHTDTSDRDIQRMT